MKLARLLIALGVLLLAMVAAPAQIVPIAISSGFTDDAVLESTDGSTTGDLAGGLNFGSGSGSDVLVAHDYAVAHPDLFDPDQVLPQNGTITNSANGAIFQFQPYDAPNVGVGDVTLTLAQPAVYSEISFLVNNRASRGVGPLVFTLNYADGVSVDDASAAPIPNWQGERDPGDGQIVRSLTTMLQDGVPVFDAVDFDEYDFNIDPSKGPLESITFHQESNWLDVYAVSGIDPVVVPEPRAWTMLVLAVMGVMIFVSRPSRFSV